MAFLDREINDCRSNQANFSISCFAFYTAL